MNQIRTPRPRTGRGPAVKTACAGLSPDTQPMVEALLTESAYQPGWKPGRAAALRALAQPSAKHCWMTTAEFRDWIERHVPPGKLRATMDELGIGDTRRRSILTGAPVTKLEALALAHYALGLPAPIPAGDNEAFADWFIPRFGGAASVARALGISSDHINDRLKGYDITDRGHRVKRTPEAPLIRALDWVWRMGPSSPYGDRVPVALFPGQPTDL